MRKENLKPFIIFALHGSNVRFAMDIIQNRGIRREQIKPVTGTYTHKDGHQVSENSYLVVYDNEQQKADIVELAQANNQESVLLVGADRFAELYYIDDKRTVYLGQFSEVSEYTAKLEKAYTYDPAKDKYYVC